MDTNKIGFIGVMVSIRGLESPRENERIVRAAVYAFFPLRWKKGSPSENSPFIRL
jgi:hypothetical protein